MSYSTFSTLSAESILDAATPALGTAVLAFGSALAHLTNDFPREDAAVEILIEAITHGDFLRSGDGSVADDCAMACYGIADEYMGLNVDEHMGDVEAAAIEHIWPVLEAIEAMCVGIATLRELAWRA